MRDRTIEEWTDPGKTTETKPACYGVWIDLSTRPNTHDDLLNAPEEQSVHMILNNTEGDVTAKQIKEALSHPDAHGQRSEQ